MKKVALVLTAGAVKEIFSKGTGKQLAFVFHWPLPFKKFIKKLHKEGKVIIAYREALKNETIARLQKALELYQAGVVDYIFSVGGFSPDRKKLGLKDSVEMMNEWLVINGVNKKDVFGEGASVDTGGNIDEFVRQLKQLDFNDHLAIHLVTSWYHLFRGKVELERVLRKEGILASIVCEAAYPKFDWETLKYEYLYNIITELPKLLSLIFPAIKTSYRKNELASRGYTCSDARKDIDTFFATQNSDASWLERALLHMTQGTTHKKHNVSCQECWDYYTKMKRTHCGG